MTPTNEAAERLREWLVGQDRPDHHGNDLLDAALAFERQASEAAPSPDPIRAAVEAEWYNGNLSEDTMNRILAAPSLLQERDRLDWEELRMDRGWPTPIHMRHAADALDMLVIPKYGDVLRWVADACDGLTATSTATEEPSRE